MPKEQTVEDSRVKELANKMSAFRSILTEFMLVVLFAIGIFFAIKEILREDVIIELIEVPKELADKFSTNLAITRQLIDAAAVAARQHDETISGNAIANYTLDRLPNLKKTDEGFCTEEQIKAEIEKVEKTRDNCTPQSPGADLSGFAGPSTALKIEPLLRLSAVEPDIQVPAIGSLRSIIRLLKPNEIHISGEISKKGEQMNLVLRSTSPKALQPEPIEESDTKKLFQEGGRALLQLHSPCIAALSYFRQELKSRTFNRTSQLIEPCKNASKEYKYLTYLLSGLIAYSKNDFGEAIKQYQMAVDNKKNSADAYFYLGLALQKEHKSGEAIANYRKAFDLIDLNQPKATETYLFWSNAILDDGRNALSNNELRDLAISKFDKIITLHDPSAADAYVFWGNALLDSREPGEAISKYQEAIKLRPNYAAAYNNLGIALYSQGKYPEAITQYSKAINSDANYVSAYCNRGIALFHKGDYQEAISDFEKASKLDPKSGTARLFNYWGNALMQSAKSSSNYKDADELRFEAINKYKKASDINPNYYLAYYNQSIAYAILGEARTNRKKPKSDYLNKFSELYIKSKELRKSPSANLAANRGNENVAAKTSLNMDDISAIERTESSESIMPERLIWPLIGGIATLLTGLLVILVKKRLALPGPISPRSPITPITEPKEKKPAPQRLTQVEEYIPTQGHQRPAVLLCVAGAMRSQKFPIAKDIFNIGANTQNDLCIPDDEYVSGHHAYLKYEKGSLVIFDPGSRNGTFVNGQRVSGTARILKSGDRIQIGKESFEVLLD